MNWLIKWYQEHTALTHTLAVVITFLVMAYFNVPAFHDYANYVYGLMPNWLKTLIGVGIALYSWYRNGYTKAALVVK